jgi:hypothetical protein
MKILIDNMNMKFKASDLFWPILFVIYINDLPDNLKSECYMFADDTKVFKDINDIEDKVIW